MWGSGLKKPIVEQEKMKTAKSLIYFNFNEIMFHGSHSYSMGTRSFFLCFKHGCYHPKDMYFIGDI